MTADCKDIAALYVTEHDRLERQIGRRVGCRNTASDLVHDIFLRLWERATDRNGDSRAYLTRCARNAAIDHIRAERTRSDAAGSILAEQYGQAPARPEEILAARQDLRSLDQVLADLPKRTRHIFILNRVHGGTLSEIASVMGVSRRTAPLLRTRPAPSRPVRISGRIRR